MHLALLLQMAAEGMPDRVAVGRRDGGITMAELAERAQRVGGYLAATRGERVALVDLNSEAVPIALFGAALAGKPFVPINYRLTDEQLRAILARTAPATVIVGEGMAERIGSIEGIELVSSQASCSLSRATRGAPTVDLSGGDPDDIAVLLYTSGTTGEPKAAVLRHRNLASYILSTVEFAGADEDEAAIVSVPPYHIAGISSVLSSTYAGRRVVYVEAFDPRTWVELVRSESVTHAMVVPTMLNRILDVLETDGKGLPSLRSLSYGGGPMPVPVIERAMRAAARRRLRQRLRPDRDVEHDRPARTRRPSRGVRQRRSRGAGPSRLGGPAACPPSRCRSATSTASPSAPASGARSGCGASRCRASTWAGPAATTTAGSAPATPATSTRPASCTSTAGSTTSSCGAARTSRPARSNRSWPSTRRSTSVAVVGIPDTEWGEKVVAAVVLVAGAEVTEDELRDHVRARLRSTKTPERIQIRQRAALQRDRQAAAPGAARRAHRQLRLSGT